MIKKILDFILRRNRFNLKRTPFKLFDQKTQVTYSFYPDHKSERWGIVLFQNGKGLLYGFVKNDKELMLMFPQAKQKYLKDKFEEELNKILDE